MKSQIIGEFYDKIFKILNENNILKSKIKTIYTKPILDPSSPCIVIEFDRAKNLSTQFQNIYDIGFLINIIIKDRPMSELQEICDILTNILKLENFGLNSFEITGLNYIDISTIPSKDMVTRKLTINYNALIKEKIL
jgi:hypothetical protein